MNCDVLLKVQDPHHSAVANSFVPQNRASLCRPPKSELHISRRSSVMPAQSSDCPLWRQFLDDVTRRDGELKEYLQCLVGYMLTGVTREHVLVFIYGPGGNGKSVFIDTIADIMADYATAAPMDAFTKLYANRHPTELAMLRGARLVTAHETEQGRAWAESRIKQMTGGDPITARFLRQDFFTYRPAFKIAIIGNYRPALQSVQDAMRRRFHIIPFTHKPERPDTGLHDKLREEAAGILRWAIEGSLIWQRRGLVPPPIVMAETENYFAAQDVLGQWLEECCAMDPSNDGWCEPIGSLFRSWRSFAEAANEEPGSMKAFAEALEGRGFRSHRRRVHGKTTRVRLGIRLSRRTSASHGVTETE